MAISDTIQSMYNNVDSAYTSLANKGATIPANKNLANLAACADSIPTGGGGGGEDVIFYDYDGTVVQSYSKDDFLALTAMPENPTHTGLVAQGWNWSLADAKTYVTDYGKLNIGATYKTASGLSEFDIELNAVTGKTITFKMAGTTNWGDGTSETTTSSSTHTYADYGKYTITCDGTSIPGSIFGSSASYFCTNVRVGESVTSIRNSAFSTCKGLTFITIPNSVTSIEDYAFAGCRCLISVTVPNGVINTGHYTFENCYSLTSIAIPNGVTYIGWNEFYNCYSLTSITLPNTIAGIGQYGFQYCHSLISVTIPGVRTMQKQSLQHCVNLTSIKFGSGVTSIGDYACNNNYNIKTYDFSQTISVPTLGSTVFNDINALCKIIVPDALYETWIAASNWTAYASYIYKASEVN